MTAFARMRLAAALLVSATALALAPSAAAKEAIVLVQLSEYPGPEAYFSLYLVSPQGKYDRTLWVSGPEKIWWPDSKRWFGYFSRQAESVDGLTGASTPSGGRAVMRVDLDPAWVDAGYKLRVETSVENADNHQLDVEVDLSTANQRLKVPGTGYVRYLRYKL
jgi:hypothetical protein